MESWMEVSRWRELCCGVEVCPCVLPLATTRGLKILVTKSANNKTCPQPIHWIHCILAQFTQSTVARMLTVAMMLTTRGSVCVCLVLIRADGFFCVL